MITSFKETRLILAQHLLSLFQNPGKYSGNLYTDYNLIIEEILCETSDNEEAIREISNTLELITPAYASFYLGCLDISWNVNPDAKKCPCCEFYSHTGLAYSICQVCGWEFDGEKNTNEFSSPNHMTLIEAKLKFIREGHLFLENASLILRIKFFHK